MRSLFSRLVSFSFRPAVALSATAVFALSGCAESATGAPAADPWQSSSLSSSAMSAPSLDRNPAAQHQADIDHTVRAVRFTLSVPRDDSPSSRAALALASALLHQGFHLTDGPGEAHIEIRRADATPEDDGTIALALIVTHRDSMIDSLVGRVHTSDRVAAAADVEDLAQRLGSSVRVASFAAYREAARAAVASRAQLVRRPVIGPIDPLVLEEEAWRTAALRRCRNDRSETSCGWIRNYLERFPNGRHASEGRAMLGLAVPDSSGRGSASLGVAATEAGH